MRLFAGIALICAGVIMTVAPAFEFVSRTDGTHVKSITGLGYVVDRGPYLVHDSGPWYSGLHYLGQTGGYVGILGLVVLVLGVVLAARRSVGAAVTGMVVSLGAAGVAVYSIANPQRVMDSPFLPSTSIGIGLWAVLISSLVAIGASIAGLVAINGPQGEHVAARSQSVIGRTSRTS